MEYREILPSPWLSAYVECFWIGRADGAPPFRPREVLIPDGTTELMLNFGGPYRRFADMATAAGGELVRGSHVLGIRERGVFIEQEGELNVFAIRFRPGGLYPFLRVSTRELAQRSVELDLLLPTRLKEELEQRVHEAASVADKVSAAEAMLPRCFRQRAGRDDRAERAIGLIYAHRGAIGVGRLGAALGVGYKALERTFEQRVGLLPKQLCRIVRLNRAITLMRRSDRARSLSSVAYTAGYADQAHLTREFGALVGVSPATFLREQFTIAEVTQPALAERLSKTFNPPS